MSQDESVKIWLEGAEDGLDTAEKFTRKWMEIGKNYYQALLKQI